MDDYRFCIKCGTKLPAESLFCAKCGTKQPEIEELALAPAPVPVQTSAPVPSPAPVKHINAPAKKSNKGLIIGACVGGGILIAIIVVLLIIIFTGNSQPGAENNNSMPQASTSAPAETEKPQSTTTANNTTASTTAPAPESSTIPSTNLSAGQAKMSLDEYFDGRLSESAKFKSIEGAYTYSDEVGNCVFSIYGEAEDNYSVVASVSIPKNMCRSGLVMERNDFNETTIAAIIIENNNTNETEGKYFGFTTLEDLGDQIDEITFELISYSENSASEFRMTIRAESGDYVYRYSGSANAKFSETSAEPEPVETTPAQTTQGNITPTPTPVNPGLVLPCSKCFGSGTCPVCHGRRKFSYNTWGQGGLGYVLCQGCQGTGRCSRCGGTGR